MPRPLFEPVSFESGKGTLLSVMQSWARTCEHELGVRLPKSGSDDANSRIGSAQNKVNYYNRRIAQLLVDELTMPQLEIQQLENLQVEVFTTRQVQVDDPSHLLWTKEAAPPDRFF